MRLLDNILDHEVRGPAILQGRQEGLQKGRIEVFRRQLEKRFGPVPNRVETRFTSLSASEISEIVVRIFRCPAHRRPVPRQIALICFR